MKIYSSSEMETFWTEACELFANHSKGLTGHRWDLAEASDEIKQRWLAHAATGSRPKITNFLIDGSHG